MLLSCWLILFFSASEINSTLLNKVDAQTSGNYHYAPGLNLTGSNYHDVTSTNSLQLSQFSVAAWFKTSTNFASDAIIVNKGGLGSESPGQNMNYGIWMTKTEKIVAGFESTTAADRFVTSPKTYNDNQWHYVIVTYGGSSVILYIDGVRVAAKSTSGASPEISGTKPVRIGANSRVTPPGNFFTGQVDEVRVWSNDLAPQQVADAFAGISFNTEEQVLYLPFGSNPPPVANNQAITVNKNTQQAITLTATDPNNDPLTYSIVTQLTHGTLTGTAPNLNYNPDTDYVGTDSFTFKANDGTTDSNIATISITVQAPANDPPVANNQAITVNKNTQQAITLTATDPNNDPLTYSIVTQPTHGTLTGTAPNLNYNPDTDYVGADSFTFKANDGTIDSNTATVSITIEDVSSCTTILPISGVIASGYQLGNPPSNAIDSDLNTRWANDGVGSWISADLGITQNICSVDIAWYNGNARQYHFIIATSTDGSTFTNVFSGDSSGTTLSSEKYTISNTDATYVRITVNGNTQNNWASIYDLKIFGSALSGNSPPVAINQAVTTGKNIAKDITLTATDPNNDPLNYSIVTQPAHGTLTGTAPNLNYNPDTDYVGADSFTFKANDGTTDGNTATVSITVDDPSKDQFGIIKLYPTKNNGEEWFINMDNPIGDSRFNPQNTITKNPDGSWKMKATQVRMNVYTSTGYNSANIPTLDHSVIASKGYMLASNDWRNFEMTQYVKVNTSPSDDNFSPYGRGGRHTGSGAPEGCEGSSMKGDVFFSGKVRFAKEQWHVSYVFTSLKTATSSIEDKWIGIKFIVYNFVENNKVVVKTELWLDINNNGNFVKYDENVDRGGWGTEGVECVGSPDQIISWGGPITTFRWDTATDVDFKNLSVREILSPQ
ncbi:MAG TPA: Ig-like domain-containing protein [Nitrososphaeraceae archaeon]|nr:Ig-like domain-containing protein [Nitrososphaeraceae archaeon]